MAMSVAVGGALTGVGGAMLIGRVDRSRPGGWRFLTEDEASLVGALAEQIIPADQDPGAKEAGAVDFIDLQLVGPYRRYQEKYRAGLQNLEQTSQKLFGKPFDKLPWDDQTKLLESLEASKAPKELWKDPSAAEFFNLCAITPCRVSTAVRGTAATRTIAATRCWGWNTRASWARIATPSKVVERRRRSLLFWSGQTGVEPVSLRHVNAVIVGAGAGGGVVANQLAQAGLSVVLLERGRWQSFDEHSDDELISQRTTVLGSAFGPDDERYRRVLVGPDGKTQIVLPSEKPYCNNAACVGGGTVSYGAMAWRLMPQDFRMLSTYRELAAKLKDHSLADWPISYDDLEPCYEKAEWEIGVAGDESQNAVRLAAQEAAPHAALSATTPMGCCSRRRPRRWVGIRFPLPMFRNSVPYGGRPQCIHMRSCVGFACPVNAKNGTQNTVIPRALATGHCELRTQCVAAEVMIDDRGRATGVRYFDADDRPQVQTADLVVVSASASETARLLLNSRSKLFPNGAGNNNDWVGRNLQGHAYSGASGLFEQEVYEEAGPGACVALCDFNHNNPGLIGGGALVNEFISLPYLFSGIASARRGPLGQGAQGVSAPHTTSGSSRCTAPCRRFPCPNPASASIRMSRTTGASPWCAFRAIAIPTWPSSASSWRPRRNNCLKEMGAVRTWPNPPGLGLSGGQHQAGTCRMGDDPKTSVTNKYGQVHEIDNLFVADGSLHVTNGGFNPVLTIMALGYWVGGYIAKEWKGGKFR